MSKPEAGEPISSEPPHLLDPAPFFPYPSARMVPPGMTYNECESHQLALGAEDRWLTLVKVIGRSQIQEHPTNKMVHAAREAVTAAS